MQKRLKPELKVTQYCVMCSNEEVSGDIILYQELLHEQQIRKKYQ